jgi:2-hydroxy-3-keto-5-methylthiopentenyl-1-phosphate phosphatase
VVAPVSLGAPGEPRGPSGPGSLDLARSSVFVDFDGTVSVEDIGTHLLRRLATGDWEAIDERYVRGEIGSRQCITELCALLPNERELLFEVASEVPLDDGFGPLVDYLRGEGAEVVVVSDGFGFYVGPRCAPFGVEAVASGLVGGRPVFPNADLGCPCARRGTCKARPIREAGRRGRTTILVGDGSSDRYAAQAAALVFAKRPLADLCRELDIPCVEFGALVEVEAELRAMVGAT